MCENLELFDEYTATLFSTLYQTFPVKQDIDILELIRRDEMSDFGTIVNAQGTPSKHAEVAWHTLKCNRWRL